MNNIDAVIQRKLIQKALKQLSEQENAGLDKLIHENEEIRQYWEETLQSLEEWGPLPDIEKSWQQVDSKLKTSRTTGNNISIITRKLIGAAIVLAILGSISLFYLQQKNKHASITSPATADLKNKKNLLLTLANGQVINLRQKQGSFVTRGIQLKNDSVTRALSYNADETDSSFNTLQVPAGLDYHLQLSDGSEITLNSATKLTFPFHFTGNSREIKLDGEAYLKVAHNPQKPFIVHLPSGDIQVLGTEFNVNTYSDQEKVSLVRGVIRFSNGKDSIQLKAGQAVLVQKQTLAMCALNMDELAWIDGKYILNNTSIKEIAELVPRWFGVEVKIDSKDIAQRRFSGIIYKNKPITGFLELLKGTNDASYYYEGPVLHFK